MTDPTTGMVRLRFLGTAPTLMPGFGQIDPGEFDCPEELALKLLAAGKDYALASGALGPEEFAETVAEIDAEKPWDAEPDLPAEKRKEKR